MNRGNTEQVWLYQNVGNIESDSTVGISAQHQFQNEVDIRIHNRDRFLLWKVWTLPKIGWQIFEMCSSKGPLCMLYRSYINYICAIYKTERHCCEIHT